MPQAPEGYALEPETLGRLQAIKRRLYSDKPLSGDERRDLANALDALLASVIPLYPER